MSEVGRDELCVEWWDVVDRCVCVVVFFFFKQKTAYEIHQWLEFRRVLFRSQSDDLILGLDIETYVESSIFDTDRTKDSLLKHFKTASLESFGCEH